jgi:hypothetical protein
MATTIAKKRTGAPRTNRNGRTNGPQVAEKTSSLGMDEYAAERDKSREVSPDEQANHAAVIGETGLSSASQSEEQSDSATAAPSKSLAQRYVLLSIQTFGDCVVQQSPDLLFDVLARNFENRWQLSYWLNKVGYDHLTPYGKNHDFIDYLRRTSHELFKSFKADIGKPVARW